MIFSFHHLCRLLGVTPNYLASVVFSPQSHYRSFDIPKRRGGVRIISAPYPLLLECQRWIYGNILSNIKISGAAHGYVKGKSIISNARLHLGNSTLLKVDIRDFFPSISIDRVIGFFRRLGYAPEIAFFLSRICCCNDSLPQGAATSPALSNILLSHMDRRLVGLARKHGAIYTRYADDIAFSTKTISCDDISSLEKILVESGFVMSAEKTLLLSAGRRKILAGIDITSGGLRVPRAFRREIRMQAHLAMTHGAIDYVLRRKQNPNVPPELAGKLAYWLQVEPENSFAREAFDAVQGMCRNVTSS